MTAFPNLGWFEAWSAAVADDCELEVFAGWSTLDFGLQAGEKLFLIRLQEGRIEEVVQEPGADGSRSFTLAGSPEDWKSFLQKDPPPFYHDLLAMNIRVPTFSIEGDWHTFLQHIRTIKRIFRIAQSLGDRVA